MNDLIKIAMKFNRQLKNPKIHQFDRKLINHRKLLNSHVTVVKSNIKKL